ncbi:MAG: helix-hairpin-helix domain-containing protein [Candidatus Eremiobacteraeota bacterium]|nr:helix-hairpin-helix domain-containing protein [Candidatus Eremiobacteraeota bacterium]
MHNAKHLRWWLSGAVVILLLGFVVARPSNGPASNVDSVSQATVPTVLLAAQSPAALDSAFASPTMLAVYVCGAVRRPGVYTFSAGLRVNDAIDRAGGALGNADLEQLNLAQTLTDAMKIDVPRKGQVLSASFAQQAISSDTTATHRARHGSGRSSHKLQPGQTLDINTATETELTQLPGVGPGLARRIVEYRTANGPFQTVDDLQNVSGIGPSKFDRMAPYIRL